MSLPTDPLVVAAFVGVAVLGAARLTRLVTQDKYPPSAWVRSTWDRLTRDGDWSLLAHCHWCFGPWAFALALGSGALLATGAWWVWWIFWGWLAGSYLTSIVVEFDEKN